ncbi:MAG: hypothetical protein LBM75_05045 [Myxococcales bacterium]|jgi:hypothetical protein|nr:hypothetical protein [Myxococcales bacterium]
MFRYFIASLTIVLFGMGCCFSSDCMSTAMEICVTDAETNEPLNDFTVEWSVSKNENGELRGEGYNSNCRTLYDNRERTYFLVIRAENYADMKLKVKVSQDICGKAVGERREVALSRESNLSKVTKAVEIEGC